MKKEPPVRYSIAQGRDRLPGLVHEAEAGRTIELTRRGKPVAVLLSLHDYQQATAAGIGFWQAIQRFRGQADLKPLRVGREFLRGLRDRSPGREVRL